MTTYRKKLLYTLIILVMVVLMAVGFLLGHLFKSYYIKTFNERIQNETFFISTYITGAWRDRVLFGKREDGKTDTPFRF